MTDSLDVGHILLGVFVITFSIMMIIYMIGQKIEMDEMKKEWEEDRIRQEIFEETKEHQECLNACREQGYTTYISAPGNCVCDTTKKVIK